jgi:aminomethyltransferase
MSKMAEALLQTPFHDWHVAHGGRMVDFAGWNMPVQYASIVEEHRAVRQAAGLFDVAHMGRLRFTGPDAERFLDHLVTNDVTRLQPGQVRYALVTNEAGGILDDVLVYRFPAFHLLVVNASNREKILGWIEQHRGGFDVEVEDLTFAQAMLALQGPRAPEILAPLTEADISQFKYYTATETRVQGVPAIVSRTGYTGEDGFEVILPSEQAVALWETLMARGEPLGLQAAGLGCRDTLRLEAAMPLYGHELNADLDPFTAGLGFAVKLDAGDFLGKTALIIAKQRTDHPVRVGLELQSRRIAREHAEVFADNERVGEVTSGTFSPTLEKSIAMAYVAPTHAALGTTLSIDIRGKSEPATVVKLPFYKRALS